MKKSSVKNSAKPAHNRLELPDKSNIALVYRLETTQAVALAKKVAEFLKKQGHEVFTAPGQTLVPGTKLAKTAKQLDALSLVIVLGGDGTYLRAVRVLEGRSIPILGFNMGSLGFLTAHNADTAFATIEDIHKGEMEMRTVSIHFETIQPKCKTPGEIP